MRKLIAFSVDHPKLVTILMLLVTVVVGVQMVRIEVDTDPENMLSEEEFVRAFHRDVKKDFALKDFVVLGIVDEEDPSGVFTPETLGRIYEVTEKIKRIEGVIDYDLISPNTTDNIKQAGLGAVRFEWLMARPPETAEEALEIRDEALDNPLLAGTLVSEDGKALAIYVPIESKDISYRVSREILELVEGLPGDEKYHITGLPVAEDTFGVEMFKQMAISAPLAGLIVFVLLLLFFRKVSIIFSPMIVAMVSIIFTMGLLIGMGFTVHIMSSMIPIFLMPIAVVDSVHILSEFSDRYQQTRDRRKTILAVMDHLFLPMLYTSLTSSAGFASLALTPIPPVQIFGAYVAVGVMTAWFLTMTFIPAYTMFISDRSLERFGAGADPRKRAGLLERVLDRVGAATVRRWKLILTVTGILIAVAAYGITHININDNPVKWFNEDHPIRVADRVLNDHFGGTYEAYLVLEEKGGAQRLEKAAAGVLERLRTYGKEEELGAGPVQKLSRFIETTRDKQGEAMGHDPAALLDRALAHAEEIADVAEGVASDDWYALVDFLDDEKVAAQPFKNPEVLAYVETLQAELLRTEIVGKSNSIVDVVKKVHYELMEGDKKYNVIPKTASAVGQVLISFQNSHDPEDLFHLVTPDYRRAAIWVQLTSGDNQDMVRVEEAMGRFIEANPPPAGLVHQWAGLTYLNVVWQDKMVSGMLSSLLGAFVIVLAMMVFLFRSPLWGLLSMIPLSVTIALIYGMIGIIGKDYDMPVAVLSALTLGLSVDFAIHFIERARQTVAETGSWVEGAAHMFAEPARAISRNVLVIAIGFLPLLAAPLVPYRTVGIFLASIMVISGLGTLFILPAMITGLQKVLFREQAEPRFCKPYVCTGVSVAVTLVVALAIHHYAVPSWKIVTFGAALFVVLAALTCNILSRRAACRDVVCKEEPAAETEEVEAAEEKTAENDGEAEAPSTDETEHDEQD